jgi:tRNA G18 (ribose-2'-O)-methylase SpoU
VEPYPSLKVFGADGKGLPAHAVKGMDELYRIFEAAKQ